MNINKLTHLYLQKIPHLNHKKIAVGYSAGADSTALLHVMVQKRNHFGFHLEAVFFSHTNSPINEGEDKNLALAKELCAQWNVPLTQVELEMNKTANKSWEELGRNGRIDFYKKADFDLVFLGHHQDDQNETTMQQIFRGGGKGVAGMKPRDGIFCRPLLKVRKKVLYDYLQKHNIPWLEDPTNASTEFTRTFWRNHALPAIEQHYPNYSDLLENFREKMNSLNRVAFDMAKQDGLEELIAGHVVDINKLADYRIHNLLSHSFSILGNYVETNKVNNWLEQGSAHHACSLSFGEYTLNFDHGKISVSHVANTSKLRLR